jgi:precorrin-2 dehydrogenase/sirohydrochlorin ferrochelatase
MLPLVFDPNATVIGLIGADEALARRLALLKAAWVHPVILDADAADHALRGLTALFVAGLPLHTARALAARARLHGVLINVEDVPALCDFHVPATVRRGDLLFTVSTGGKAPGLARVLREWLERQIGRDWGEHLAEVEAKRHAWRSVGHSLSEVSRRTRALVGAKGWLA